MDLQFYKDVLNYMNLQVYNPITRQRYMEQRFLAETAVPEKTSWFSGEARGTEQGSQDPVEKISEIIEDEDLFGESRRN